MARHLIAYNEISDIVSTTHTIACDGRTRLAKKYFVRPEWLDDKVLPSCKSCKEKVVKRCENCRKTFFKKNYWESYSICDSCVADAHRITSECKSLESVRTDVAGAAMCTLCVIDHKYTLVYSEMTIAGSIVKMCYKHFMSVSDKMFSLVQQAVETEVTENLLRSVAFIQTTSTLNTYSSDRFESGIQTSTQAANFYKNYQADVSHELTVSSYKQAQEETYQYRVEVASTCIIGAYRSYAHHLKSNPAAKFKRTVTKEIASLLSKYNINISKYKNVLIASFTEKQCQAIDVYIKSNIAESGITLLEFMIMDM